MSCPSATIQRDIVNNLFKSGKNEIRIGALWYICAAKWHAEWSRYVDGGDAQVPDSISNEDLVEGGANELRKGLLEGVDFCLLPACVWEALFEWYGGGPVLQRAMIEVGQKKRLVVEVYPLHVHVSERLSGGNKTDYFQVSQAALGQELLLQVCRRWFMAPHRCKLWRLSPEDGHHEVELKRSLLENMIYDQSSLLVEEQTPDGAFESLPPPWQRPLLAATTPVHRGQARAAMAMVAQDSLMPSSHPGVTGLSNLGNTCFMASSLQCLAAITVLREFLCGPLCLSLINKTNPLGTGGRIVRALAELMSKMWCQGNLSSIVPRAIKNVISDYAPQFEGYRQHDAHEFLAFLLDGLHEDLNQVKTKPLVQRENAAEGPDEGAAADRAWQGHLARNNSFVVQWFHGQLRSRLTCPECTHVSITFDPMSSLSLPLPHSTTRLLWCTFVPIDKQLRVERIPLVVPRVASIGQLKRALLTAVPLPNLPLARLLLGEVYQRCLHREYSDDSSDLSAISPGDELFAYELEHATDAILKGDKVKVGNIVLLTILLRGADDALFGTPLAVTADLRNGFAGIQKAICKCIEKAVVGAARFSLVLTSKSGKNCANCDDSSCRGCQLTEAMFDPKTRVEIRGTKVHVLQPRMNVCVVFSTPAEFVLKRVERENHAEPASASKQPIQLEQCLLRFLEPEILSASEKWFCPSCKQFVQAEKQISLWRIPRVVIVHLKRFSGHREKIDDFVSFPLRGLDLHKFEKCPNGVAGEYRLVGISNHMGGLGGGHYVAHTLHQPTNSWYLYNDEYCSKVEESSVVSKSAYLLFYERHPL